MKLMLSLVLLTFLLKSNYVECISDCAGYDCLKEYIDKPDSHYAWTDTRQRLRGIDPLHMIGWTGYVLNFTSQQWGPPDSEVSRSIWWHQLVIIIPDNIEYTDEPFVWITGGNNNCQEHCTPDVLNTDILIAADYAVSTRSIGSALFQVPNQPLEFSDDPLHKSRSEDGIIAYTWWKFLNDPHSNPYIELHIPMAKAAVRAMDTITAFMTDPFAPQEILELQSNPQQFIIGGASKRGWTTWLTGAVDPRVMAIVPVVMDLLNARNNLHHHFQAYGGWSFAFNDYYEMNLTREIDSNEFATLLNIVDPYEFREKLLMPKLVCTGAMDEFFVLDDSYYWWHQMPYADEMNRLIIVPNAEHSQITGFLELLPAFTTWARALLNANSKMEKLKQPLKSIEDRNLRSIQLMELAKIPKISWTVDEVNGDIIVQSDTKPKAVHVWHANSCGLSARRDFRIVNLDDPCLCGFKVPDEDLCANLAVLWSAEEIKETSPGTWIAHREAPIGRWTSFFIDLQFDGPQFDYSVKANSKNKTKAWPFGQDGVYVFTTEASVVPRRFPFQDCQGQECYGTLL